MKCRPIGGMKAEQSAQKGKSKMIRNDRFIAVPDCSSVFEKIKSVDDLPNEIMKQLESFFIDYNKIEGKEFKVLKKLGPKDVLRLIEKN